uniref:Rx N-terminal domain-containing protein n=1 Tax=Oryza rufipogon TaxID=4529 RepID=A0A0E0R625_ORYRU
MAEAAALALSKISIALGDEATKAVIAKLSGIVTNLRELPDKVEYIRREVCVMRDVIQDLDSTNISTNVVKGRIDELRKLAFRVEDVMDKYSYYASQRKQERSLMRFMKGTHYAGVFNEVANEVMKIKGDIEQVKRQQLEWFPTVQLIPRTPTDNETPRSQGRRKLLGCGDPVGIEYNREKLLELLYSDEPHHRVITVSGMGGLGKTTLALDVYEREKIKFPVHAWITVSQTYTIVTLLRQRAFYNRKDHMCPPDLENVAVSIVSFAVEIEYNGAEDVAEGNLMELIQRNMLEVDEYDELGRVSSCKMHDIVRNLALSIARQERFGYANDYGAVEKVDWEVRRLSLFLNKGKGCASTVKFPHLRTLLETTTHPPGLLSSILSESKYLTVLELQDSDIQWRTQDLNPGRTRLYSLPESIEKLSNLQTLDIKQTKIEKLPRGITKIKKLRHLLADRYDDEKHSEFRLLLSAKDENEPLCFEALQPISNELHRLIIRGQCAKGTLDYPIFHSHGTHLKYLALSRCNLGEDPLAMLASHLSNLTYLRLNNMHSAKRLVLDAAAFPCLKTLVLKHMPDVNQLKIISGALPVIEGLYIVALSGLESVPSGIETLRTLKKLWLVDLHWDFEAHWIESEMDQKMQHVQELIL